jgi:hypothetical protein
MPVRALSTIAGNSSPSVYPRAHSASLRSTNLGMSVSPDPSLFLCHTERSEEPMHCASVEERPFRAASERAERGFSPRVLLAGPAEPRQPPVSFYSVILSEAKDPMPVGAPFDYCREFSPPGAACPARRAFCECVGFAVRHTVLAALITVKLWSPTPLSPSHKNPRPCYMAPK